MHMHGVPSLLVSSQVEVPINMWGKLLAICETLIKYLNTSQPEWVWVFQ